MHLEVEVPCLPGITRVANNEQVSWVLQVFQRPARRLTLVKHDDKVGLLISLHVDKDDDGE